MIALKEAGLCGNEVRDAFFVREGDPSDGNFKCKECSKVYKAKNGNTNLITRASTHEGWKDIIVAAKSVAGPLDMYIDRKVSPKG